MEDILKTHAMSIWASMWAIAVVALLACAYTVSYSAGVKAGSEQCGVKATE